MAKIQTTLDDVFRATPMGDFRSAIGTTFYGINHRQTPNPVPINTDGYGLTFFTRPQLNLSDDNIRAIRKFTPLLTTQAASIQRIIRCYLDPRLGWGAGDRITCPFVDNQNAFLPVLTNHLLSCSGWPDPVLDTYTSKPGAYKEVFGWTDSTAEIFSAYDITASFRNMAADPITLLYYTWMQYQSYVGLGELVPYPDYLVKNEIDYNTRIYRLVLDKTKRFVQKIACTGAAHPVTGNLGSAFSFEHDKPLNETHERIDVQFRCYGAVYNDPLTIESFNKVVGIFNPDMRPAKKYGTVPQPTMVQVPLNALDYFNSTRAYPFINPDTYELCWYVSTSDFTAELEAYSKHMEALYAAPKVNPNS